MVFEIRHKYSEYIERTADPYGVSYKLMGMRISYLSYFLCISCTYLLGTNFLSCVCIINSLFNAEINLMFK